MTASEFLIIAAMCAPSVHPTTLNAIVSQESAFNQYAIGVNGGNRLERQPENEAQAVITAKWLLEQNYNFDVGLGQINITNFEWLGLSIEDAFDPCKNLQSVEKVLQDCYGRAVQTIGGEGQGALQAALSCYNTGNFTRGFDNGYVYQVAQNAQPIPAIDPSAVNTDRPEPIRLQGTRRQNNQSQRRTTPPEGIQDAFSQPVKDAFQSPENNVDSSSENTKETQIDEP